jgi:hypothetical protein
MEEKIFYENSKFKVTQFTIEARGFTIPITQIIKVSSRLVGQSAAYSLMVLFALLLVLSKLFSNPSFSLWWWGCIFACFLFVLLTLGVLSNSFGVALQTQARPSKYVVIEDISMSEAEIIKEKITEAIVENMKHR